VFQDAPSFDPAATSAEYANTLVSNVAGFIERNREYPAAEPLIEERSVVP
jgi:hypothetical protein